MLVYANLCQMYLIQAYEQSFNFGCTFRLLREVLEDPSFSLLQVMFHKLWDLSVG